MRKHLIGLFLALPAILVSLNCGGYSSGNNTKNSGIHDRAFISDSVNVAGIYIVNVQTDVHPQGLTPIPAGNTPGIMAVTPNRAQTVVFSGNNTQFSDNLFSIINNTSENAAATVTLPGYTESMIISPDSSTAYIAIPSGPVVGQSPGKIEMVAIAAALVAGEVDIPSVHYLSISNDGNRLLAFTDVMSSLGAPCDPTPSFLFVVTPSDVGIQPCPAVPVTGFDHPVQAYFSSDDSVAYVVNCGAECGGVQASIQQLDMTSNTLIGPAADVCAPATPGVAQQCAASVALVDGSTMYLAGTPYIDGQPSQACTGQTTQATTCGLLTIFDLSTMSVVNTTPIIITDGYHNRIAMGSNGQLFIGARTCTEIQQPNPTNEIRGCLSIYNTLGTAVGSVPAGGVAIPPMNGDATGLQPIATRTVVYVIQGGSLRIYDTTIDDLEFNPNDPKNPGQVFGLVGDFIDVKTVDF